MCKKYFKLIISIGLSLLFSGCPELDGKKKKPVEVEHTEKEPKKHDEPAESSEKGVPEVVENSNGINKPDPQSARTQVDNAPPCRSRSRIKI